MGHWCKAEAGRQGQSMCALNLPAPPETPPSFALYQACIRLTEEHPEAGAAASTSEGWGRRQEIDDLLDELVESQSQGRLNEKLLAGGPWQVMYTRGRTQLWNALQKPATVVAKQAKQTNRASQDLDPSTRSLVSRADFFGPGFYVTASGTYTPLVSWLGRGLGASDCFHFHTQKSKAGRLGKRNERISCALASSPSTAGLPMHAGRWKLHASGHPCRC